ncbi:hypothetical protein L228DRAFT_239702 [Xylona heveae TC161]|uniref:Cleavage and polyadenylation specificity factor subunit 2 n=1 Tax=Xylona heveae (strain CBS 132557 / TC161) TaxID=1328760 RepID=A0A165G5C1_XYLHT|nr:hypothetical protein L228DRAFT_239702 [Xylona heveae TC161]KZF21756.1 hypothetical protein L228DRAFT_239702 [Xylona heveae TC161]
MFTFTPLLGAQSESSASQSLLELDGGIKILIDVGWDVTFDVEKLKALEKHVPTLSIILLTHATPAHLAAFAHCCKHFPLFTRIPIYATTPVISLGRTLLQDLYSSTPLASTLIPKSSLSESSYALQSSDPSGNASDFLLHPPTADEIATYFSHIHPLKYSQPHQPLPSPFSPPLNGLTITAYNAGHTLGGTIWHIQHGLESIVYAVDWNQARENVLAGAAWLGGAGAGGNDVVEQLRKPTALVCGSTGAQSFSLPGGRRRRDELLLNSIRATLSKGGTVLIPTDSSSRILELAYLLEHAWRAASDDSLKGSRLFLASRKIGTTMKYARSMLEWMDESIIREFEADDSSTLPQRRSTANNRPERSIGHGGNQRDSHHTTRHAGPFDFRYLKLLERKSQVDRALAIEGGKVILASDSSLDWGFSRDVLLNIASNSSNLVVLTEKHRSSSADEPDSSSLGRLLYTWWDIGKGAAVAPSSEDIPALVPGQGREIHISEAHRVPLEGQELVIYQQYLATQRQLHNILQSEQGANLDNAADAVDDASSTSSSSEESESEHQGKALNISATMAHSNRNKLGLSNEELGINVLLRRRDVHDYDVRNKRGREKMFPFVAKRRRGDEFGELIRPEDYLRAEEREEVDGLEIRGTAADSAQGLGQKRKWDEATGANGSKNRRQLDDSNKRQRDGKDVGAVNSSELDASEHPVGVSSLGFEDEGSSSESEADEPATIPSKLALKTRTVGASFNVTFIDFMGLHDKRSLQMLIPLIQPRKLILVGGTTDETSTLADDCRKLLSARLGASAEIGLDILTPIVGQAVDASVDTNAWVVKLSDTLVRRLHWQSVRGLGVVTVTGRLEAKESPNLSLTSLTKRQKLDRDNADDIAEGEDHGSVKMAKEPPTLDVLPASIAAATRSVAQPLHVGDLRLADLRKIMQASGHLAEFRGEGTLVIDGLVAVRKTGTGRIEVEGGGLFAPGQRSSNMEGSFYAVKRKIYEGLAVVSGG